MLKEKIWVKTIIFSLGVLVLWMWLSDENLWVYVFLLNGLFVCAVLSLMRYRQHKQRSYFHRSELQCHEKMIQTLSDYRHNWMNDLQILSGYLSLNKKIQALSTIDKIKRKMEQDSKISQLGHTELVAFLLSQRANCQAMRLEVDFDNLRLDQLSFCSFVVDKLAHTIMRSVNIVSIYAAPPLWRENILSIRLLKDSEQLTLNFRYEGQFTQDPAEGLDPHLTQCWADMGQGVDSFIEKSDRKGESFVHVTVVNVPLSN